MEKRDIFLFLKIPSFSSKCKAGKFVFDNSKDEKDTVHKQMAYLTDLRELLCYRPTQKSDIWDKSALIHLFMETYSLL